MTPVRAPSLSSRPPAVCARAQGQQRPGDGQQAHRDVERHDWDTIVITQHRSGGPQLSLAQMARHRQRGQPRPHQGASPWLPCSATKTDKLDMGEAGTLGRPLRAVAATYRAGQGSLEECCGSLQGMLAVYRARVSCSTNRYRKEHPHDDVEPWPTRSP
ncbi:MAG: hypothetical protein HC828_13750 [Blastochloris sp.]|nr:hypothetical protein [Blastochloris sp.]